MPYSPKHHKPLPVGGVSMLVTGYSGSPLSRSSRSVSCWLSAAVVVITLFSCFYMSSWSIARSQHLLPGHVGGGHVVPASVSRETTYPTLRSLVRSGRSVEDELLGPPIVPEDGKGGPLVDSKARADGAVVKPDALIMVEKPSSGDKQGQEEVPPDPSRNGLPAVLRHSRPVVTMTPQERPPPEQKKEIKPLQYPVWWFAPFWSGSGYSSEAINYMLSLLRSGVIRREDLWLSHSGDNARDDVIHAMDVNDRKDLEELQRNPDKSRPAIIVCHSLPTNYAYPDPPQWIVGARCPPDPREHGWAYLIGRTMFETDHLPKEFVTRINNMNEVWVPSEFSKEVFINSGVPAEKIVIMPEGINTTYLDPALYQGLDLRSRGEAVFGPALKVTNTSNTTGHENSTLVVEHDKKKPFVFISSFKWESRKGWDVLLAAYLTEFSEEDNVELYMLTKPFMSGGDFKEQMYKWAREELTSKETVNFEEFPSLYVISKHISDEDFPRFYKAGDAFVLPSRGEGWGRPHVEAMAMGLPVISTNWSGIMAYLDEEVGYPIRVDELVDVKEEGIWWFKDSKWAQPSVAHLRQLMRRVVENPHEAQERGKRAREKMIREYSPEPMAALLMKEFERIQGLIPDIPEERTS